MTLTVLSFTVLIFAGLSFATFNMANAQDFPQKTIRIVVPFAPGGPTDLMARAISKTMSQSMGQQVVVDNKPGGGGLIGFAEAVKAPADGYTLVFPSLLAVTNPALIANYPYDMNRDFAAITIVGFIPHILVVRPESNAKSLTDLIAIAKEKPNSLSYASSGNGTSAHLAGAMFVERAGIKATHVPYRGAAPALQDLLGGQIDFMFLDTSLALTQIKAGKLRPLAIAPAKRITALPDIATLAEQGITGYNIRAWYGLMVKAGTPQPVVTKLYEEVKKALNNPEVRDLFRNQGIEPGGMTPAEYSTIIREDLIHWKRTIEALNIKSD